MWSRIQDTELAIEAYIRMNENEMNGCYYHNNDHISAMYQYLDDTKEPYNEALDWSVMFHDAVYDNQPDKERRSLELFVKMSTRYSGCKLDGGGIAQVGSAIMSTKNHTITSYSTSIDRAIIRADLHALTDKAQTARNFVNIMDESIALYSIDIDEYVDNTIAFMQGLRRNMHYNRKRSTNKDAAFFEEVIKGINQTIALAHAMLEE